MSRKSRFEYIDEKRRAYAKSAKAKQSRILDEVGQKGRVCIASRGKVKNFAWKRSLSENGDSADVFGRAFEGFKGASSPDGGWGNAPVLLLILARATRRANRARAVLSKQPSPWCLSSVLPACRRSVWPGHLQTRYGCRSRVRACASHRSPGGSLASSV